MVSSVLALGRQAVRRRMRATCIIERVGELTTDPETGEVARPREQIYPDPDWPEGHPDADGKCYVRYPGLAHESRYDSAGVSIVQARPVVRVPHGPSFLPNDLVTILSDRDTPRLAGTVLQVATDATESQASAQRLICNDYQSGVSVDGFRER